jgi:hypothetical protein
VVTIVFEGDPHCANNGSLTKGLRHLFEKDFPGRMPKITVGTSTTEAIRKVVKGQADAAVVDLDASDSERDKRLREFREHVGNTGEKQVYFMVQQMEAWFFSQPEILDEYYHLPIRQKYVNRDARLISDPARELRQLTVGTQKGRYQKIKHGIDLLLRIDPVRLANDFPDFRDVIRFIQENP